VLEFILVSIQHFDAFDVAVLPQSVRALVSQYNAIYPYPEKVIPPELAAQLEENLNIHRVFGLLAQDFMRGRK